MRERIYCPDCSVEMEFHPVTSDYTLTRADLMSEDDLLSGILDEFYSCPECGRTAIPNEIYAEQTVVAYRWNTAAVFELF
jgi:hypothetical protein